MSITGPGSITAANVAAQTNMMNQLNTLGEELASGQAAQTYYQLGSQSGVAVALGAQLSDINGYTSTASNLGTTLDDRTDSARPAWRHRHDGRPVDRAARRIFAQQYGQTTTQVSAASHLNQIVALLNTQIGGDYIFSGSAVNQPSVVSSNEMINGNGPQAGLAQLISERLQADLGTAVTGRLTATVTGAGSMT